MLRRYGKIARVNILGTSMFIVNDPEMVQEFSTQKAAVYQTRYAPAGHAKIQNLDMPPNEQTSSAADVRGIVFSQGDIHKLHRSLGMKSLNSPSVRERMDDVVHGRARELRERWMAADPDTLQAGFNAFFEAQRYTVDGAHHFPFCNINRHGCDDDDDDDDDGGGGGGGGYDHRGHGPTSRGCGHRGHHDDEDEDEDGEDEDDDEEEDMTTTMTMVMVRMMRRRMLVMMMI